VIATVALSADAVSFTALRDTRTLTASVLDAGGQAVVGAVVTWSSSNDAVATVSSSGLITAVWQGTVTVTASSGTASSEATVTVDIGFGDENFAAIPSGSFDMGDAVQAGAGMAEELPVHTVNITAAFRMQKTEVTQAQWQEIMGTSPSFHPCGDVCPVEQVSWEDVQEFMVSLNARDPGKGYRLPTEAEWEYAARAGTTGDFGGTGVLDEMGWYNGNSDSTTHTVKGKEPNAWGLHDMHGNVWEWVQDWFGGYPVGPVDDPTGPATGSARVGRGGSYADDPPALRSSSRLDVFPTVRNRALGFRLVRDP
jgi:formylglycine-generating enzyme required for sulfatase activity